VEFDLTFWEWALILFAGFLVGISKAGLKGIAIIIVTIMANLFDAKVSTSIVLVMFISGDLMAVNYYKRDVNWKLLFRLIPFMILGVLIGAWIGKDLNETTFKYTMAVIILLSVILMVWSENRKSTYVPDNLGFAGIMGLAAGVTTMIGNLAGPFSNLFFLAMRSPKNEFIGTAAWLFFIVNLFKVPIHIFFWGTLTWETFKINLMLLPAIILGFIVGVQGISYIKDDHYRKLILVMTAIGAILILMK